MTGQPTMTGQSEPVKVRRPRNRWELSLSVLGAVLLGVGVATVYLISKVLFTNVGTSSQSDAFWRGIAEILYSILPGVISAALLCFIVAIGLRALEVNVARRPVTLPSTSAPAVESAPVESAPVESAPAAPAAPTAREPTELSAATAPSDRDYSRFMRPPADVV